MRTVDVLKVIKPVSSYLATVLAEQGFRAKQTSMHSARTGKLTITIMLETTGEKQP